MSAKYTFICEHKDQFTIRLMCRVLEVCRSAFHAFVTRSDRRMQRAERDGALLTRILEIFKEHKRRYGAPRIHAQLLREGWSVSKKKVAKIMKENSIFPPRKKKRPPVTTDSNHAMAPSPNLLQREFDCLTPNIAWLTDITYCATDEGWLYLACVKDMATREIVGWSMSDSLQASLCIDALNMAIMRYRPTSGLILHSDRGVQYACKDYRKIMACHGFQQSMSRRGNCLDNAPMESFFSSIKTEMVHTTRFVTRQQARSEIFEYIEVYYNRQRLHSAVGYATPCEARAKMTANMAA
ncbi:IS3 family transposase [Pseudovibrio ascidiaceicola]|uniref:IS3 family transposase n=1 Tax=Pseudovibrio ascidiaceicola TaxID=285279 RepID=UPI003D363E4A